MTFAINCFDTVPSIPILDRAISDDAREIRRIRFSTDQFESSVFFGFSKAKLLMDLKDALIEASEIGWDGYGALPAEPGAVLYACQFLEQLSSNLPPPGIIVDTDGEIAIEWDYGPRRIISVRVGRDGTLNYAGLVGHSVFHGVEFLREGIPNTISSAIERVINTPHK